MALTSCSFSNIVNQLCNENQYKALYHSPKHGELMPSVETVKKIIDILRETFFPGYFGNSGLTVGNMEYYQGVNIDTLYKLLTEQIRRGLCFACENSNESACGVCDEKSEKLAFAFIEKIPHIRHLLSTDVIAAYNGDPAAKSFGEVIFCYPCIRTLTNYRVAHEMLKLNIPLLPRIITELAHSETGIDIHPGASIDEFFTIDHGTGVVIGETCVIGKNVKIYQGVTLGAKSFPLDEKGNPIKGIARHPIVEDNVIIYAGATILGRIRIGRNSVIGGNLWITQDVEPDSKLVQKNSK